MTIHHVLCVHGIGQHSNEWLTTVEKGDEKSLSGQFFDLIGTYPALKAVNADSVKLHSIHYDDEILKLFGNWSDQVKTLKEGLSSSPLLMDQAAKFTEIIETGNEARANADFKFTHLLDVLLFVGSPSIQDRLVTYVGRQLMELIDANQADTFSLIGHSMGTAMAHKVIQAMFNEGVVDERGVRHTLKGNFRFECVAMVANASYALSRDRANFYKGIVRPSMKSGAGCCTKWINVNHRLDPVGRFMPFDSHKDPDWLDRKTDLRHFHRDIVLSRISRPGIHDLSHYLRDPGFHIPLFELLFGRDIPDKQRDDAVKAFEDATPEGQFKSLKSHLETLDVADTESFADFYDAVRAFIDLIRQFA